MALRRGRASYTVIVDTSALVALLQSESQADRFIEAMIVAESRLVSTASYVEAGLKLAASRRNALSELDELVDRFELTLVDVTVEQAREAVRARARYGGRPAQLNFGDCLVYALAKITGEPLLFKGDDFAQTDVSRVL